jgi:hypothetical protein
MIDSPFIARIITDHRSHDFSHIAHQYISIKIAFVLFVGLFYASNRKTIIFNNIFKTEKYMESIALHQYNKSYALMHHCIFEGGIRDEKHDR